MPLSLPFLWGLAFSCYVPSVSPAIVGFSLDIEPNEGPDSVAFVNTMAAWRAALAGTGMLLSADAGTAWSTPAYQNTTVNGTTKLLSEWLVDICDEAILMSYDRNATRLLERVLPYLTYADSVGGGRGWWLAWPWPPLTPPPRGGRRQT